MDARSLAKQQAAGRAVIGAALALAPGFAARGWIGPSAAADPATQVVTTAVGGRDLAIALGVAASLRAGRGTRTWLLAGVLADTADLVATLRSRDALSRQSVVGVGLLAGGSAALGLWLAQRTP